MGKNRDKIKQNRGEKQLKGKTSSNKYHRKTYKQIDDNYFHNGHIAYRRSDHRPQNKIWKKGVRSESRWVIPGKGGIHKDEHRRIREVVAYKERELRREIKQQLIDEAGGIARCGICGEIITKEKDITIDHIIPVFRGGRTTVGNCQLAHKRCNLKKGSEYDPTQYQNQKYRQ